MEPKVLLITDRANSPKMGAQLLVLSGIDISVQDHNITTDEISALVLDYYALILLNLYERPSDSAEVCQQLRAKYDKPILVMMHAKDEASLLRVYDAGADDCLVQPMDNRLLLAKVQAWLRHTRLSY